ncbi:unnamed protein product [Mucor circinelloides]|uniref:Transcription elongation factor Eaf N-terminal domain-containing protein n=1 Tax=Mucor circinelloides f. circinelloides (strain 1006PhL) TaxID=1220926 RepID=S2JCN5_MUCC1|nr:hypothetical protein HMPREF1544_05655 [Mucor circinelloides 1006PhL]
MVFEFLESGQFKVVLGKSFDVKPKKKAQKFFNVKHANSSDRSIFGKDAKLEKKNDRYQVEMKHSDKPNVVYDAQVTTEEEYNCILIYNDETKTFTLERQSAQINLTNRQLELPNGQLNHSPVPKPFIHTPPQPTTTVVQPQLQLPKPAPVTTVTASPQRQQEEIIEEDASVADDFDFDISKDMDAILDSDVEDDKSESESDSDVFEEIAAPIALPPQNMASPLSLPVTPSLPASPNIPLNLALPTTPQQQPHQPSPVQNNKKRKLKMASAPIRHPGIASPSIAAVPPPPPPTAAAAAAVATPTAHQQSNKRLKTTHGDSSSSSGSSDEEDDDDDSSSGSESGSTASSSGSESESGSSSSDDMDFDTLANDISMSLSKGGPSAPPSPQHVQHQPSRVNTPGMPSPSNFRRSPYQSNTPTPTNRPPTQNGASAGPMSLRALFKEDDEEEGLSSSDDEDSD